MNSTLYTSDRATHLKIGLTAVLATALVIVVGMNAASPTGIHSRTMPAIASPDVVAAFMQGVPEPH